MDWDKYEYGFCNSTVGIFKTYAVHHTQIGGKDAKFQTSEPALRWSDFYEYMHSNFGILPLNYEERNVVSHTSVTFLEVAHGNGYGSFTILH